MFFFYAVHTRCLDHHFWSKRKETRLCLFYRCKKYPKYWLSNHRKIVEQVFRRKVWVCCAKGMFEETEWSFCCWWIFKSLFLILPSFEPKKKFKQSKGDFELFCRKIGWTTTDGEVERKKRWFGASEFIYDVKKAPDGHLPLTSALRGTSLIKNLLNHPVFDNDEWMEEPKN